MGPGLPSLTTGKLERYALERLLKHKTTDGLRGKETFHANGNHKKADGLHQYNLTEKTFTTESHKGKKY